MASDKLKIYKRPKLRNPRLLLGLSGWMDGGEVSTGTMKCLIDKLGAVRFAEIVPPNRRNLDCELFRPFEEWVVLHERDEGMVHSLGTRD